MKHFINIRHLIIVQTLASKYYWHLINSKYVPNLYYRIIVASKTKNCDLNFIGSDEVGYTI
jgi:hypothetical protein